MACELCETVGGQVLWEDDYCRAVWAYTQDHPGVCRVVWDKHVKEMADLRPKERDRIMRVVFAVERALIQVLEPEKINLASLGNVVPHIHWHIVPRFRDDPHFPNPVWGARMRDSTHTLAGDFAMRMREALDQLLSGKR